MQCVAKVTGMNRAVIACPPASDESEDSSKTNLCVCAFLFSSSRFCIFGINADQCEATEVVKWILKLKQFLIKGQNLHIFLIRVTRMCLILC